MIRPKRFETTIIAFINRFFFWSEQREEAKQNSPADEKVLRSLYHLRQNLARLQPDRNFAFRKYR